MTSSWVVHVKVTSKSRQGAKFPCRPFHCEDSDSLMNMSVVFWLWLLCVCKTFEKLCYHIPILLTKPEKQLLIFWIPFSVFYKSRASLIASLTHLRKHLKQEESKIKLTEIVLVWPQSQLYWCKASIQEVRLEIFHLPFTCCGRCLTLKWDKTRFNSFRDQQACIVAFKLQCSLTLKVFCPWEVALCVRVIAPNPSRCFSIDPNQCI